MKPLVQGDIRLEEDFKTPTFLEMFEERVRNDPKHCAVRDDKNSLSYQELNKKANQLAHYLVDCAREKGWPVPAFIGHLFYPGCEGIVALLAILKAGMVYVPLVPKEEQGQGAEAADTRIIESIEVTKPHFILTQSPVLSQGLEKVEGMSQRVGHYESFV